MLLLVGTGLRWGEATALTVADVDLDPAVPSVRVTKAWKRGEQGTFRLGGPKTRRSRRTVTLPLDVLAAVVPLCVGRSGDELLFTGRNGARVAHQNFHGCMRTPLRAALPEHRRPTIHDLRHTHASMLIKAGVPLPVIQRRLGHESIQTTIDVYGHERVGLSAVVAGGQCWRGAPLPALLREAAAARVAARARAFRWVQRLEQEPGPWAWPCCAVAAPGGRLVRRGHLRHHRRLR